MKLPPRLLILDSVLGLFLLAAVGFGLYGLIAGPPKTTPETAQTTPASEPTGTPRQTATPTVLPKTGNAEDFAHAVVAALFDWDTTRLSGPEVIVDQLMTVAEPSGNESPGLYSDLGEYLPTAQQWRQLRQYDTTQHLTDVKLSVPKAWDAIIADPANKLAKGTVAITIDATRVREGAWHDETTRNESPVEFTMFLACPPATHSCAVLRLSALGSALR